MEDDEGILRAIADLRASGLGDDEITVADARRWAERARGERATLREAVRESALAGALRALALAAEALILLAGAILALRWVGLRP